MDPLKERSPTKHIFFLSETGPGPARDAREYLLKLEVKVLNRQGDVALVGLATSGQVEAAYKSGLFSAISSAQIKEEHLEALLPEQQPAAGVWNAMQSEAFYEGKADRSETGKSWNDKEKDSEPPHLIYDPEEFKERVLEYLQVEEEEIFEKYGDDEPVPLVGEPFIAYEGKLRELLGDPTIAYQVARIAFWVEPAWRHQFLELPEDFFHHFFGVEPPCWKMQNEISVGVVFVESAEEGGPQFTEDERDLLQAYVVDGLDWLAAEAPASAHLTWVYDWQFVTIGVANGTNSSVEDYWRNPAMGQVSYNGNTYTQDWNGSDAYREDMRQQNRSSHAMVVFVTPYANEWHAYARASRARITLANRNNWGNWGIHVIPQIMAHETCHIFGACDEYTGSGTPCSSCDTLHGCYQVPNGNCGSCARPFQTCIMDRNYLRICAYTQAHIGWADLFVELTTADTRWSGTDDDVWLDTGDHTFLLQTPDHDDREDGNREGYALCYTGLNEGDIKRIGIRKAPDSYAGQWELEHVRVWFKGTLVCDEPVWHWFERDRLWWASETAGTSSDIVNRLELQIATADESGAGTDDTVTVSMGGRSWELVRDRNDFERGEIDAFRLDPGTSLYRSALNSVQIQKAPDGLGGGWKLAGLKILVNGDLVYDNQSINTWLQGSDRDWSDTF